jgi:hypothetical protein
MHDHFSEAAGAGHDHLAADHDAPASATGLESSSLDAQPSSDHEDLTGLEALAHPSRPDTITGDAGTEASGAAATGIQEPTPPSAADQLHESISQLLAPQQPAAQPSSLAWVPAPAVNPHEPVIETPIPSADPDLHGNPVGYVAPVVNDGRWGMEPVGTDWQGNPIEQQGQLPGSDVIGNPEGQGRYWTYMGTESGFCGPESVSMVLSEFGIQANEDEIAELAISSGDATGSVADSGPGELGYGMTAPQMAEMLDRLGVPAMATTGTYGDLVQALENGRDVILSIDANLIWHNDPESQMEGENKTESHAVVLTGIDPATGMAYLNDPGTPDGRMEAVPLNELMAAWQNGGNAMVVTEHVTSVNTSAGVDTYGEQIQVGPDADAAITAITPGPIVLPITLHLVDADQSPDA